MHNKDTHQASYSAIWLFFFSLRNSSFRILPQWYRVKFMVTLLPGGFHPQIPLKEGFSLLDSVTSHTPLQVSLSMYSLQNTYMKSHLQIQD